MNTNKLDFEKLLKESIDQLSEYSLGNGESVEVFIYRLSDFPQINFSTGKS